MALQLLPIARTLSGECDVTETADGQLSKRVSNVLQAIIVSALLGVAKMTYSTQEMIHDIHEQTAVTATTVQGIKDQIHDANIPQLKEDVATLKTNVAWMQRVNTHSLPSP